MNPRSAIRAIAASLAGAGALAGAAGAQPAEDTITRAEAETLSPARFAERYLAGRMAPETAVDASLGRYGPMETTLQMVTVLARPEAAPERDGYCRQTGFYLFFRPLDGDSAAPLRRDTPHVFSSARPAEFYAERPAGVACADTGGELAEDSAYFGITGEPGPALLAIDLMRETLARVKATGDANLDVFCRDYSRLPGRGPCQDLDATMARLADAPVGAARFVGDDAGDRRACPDALLQTECHRISFGALGPRGERLQLYVSAAPDARAMRLTASGGGVD